MFFFLLGRTNDFTDLPLHALLCRKNRGLLHITEQEPDPLAQPRSTEATFVAGMESAHAEEMLQATAPPLLMNDPKPLLKCLGQAETSELAFGQEPTFSQGCWSLE